MKTLFSIIIPTLNEEKLLPRLLKQIQVQSDKHSEVIVVDAGSSDNTLTVARSFAKHFPLKIVKISDKNISRSRNTGAKHAKGEYLFFIDADNYIYASFLADIRNHIAKGFELVVPAVIPDSEKIFYNALYSSANSLIKLGNFFKVSFSTGGNFVIKRSIFEKLKGFDETLYVGEDHDFIAKARKNHVKTIYTKNPSVIFSVRRFEKEGMAVFAKYFVSTVHIAFFGKITKKIYNYQMGGHHYDSK